jgi:hypothetical protein
MVPKMVEGGFVDVSYVLHYVKNGVLEAIWITDRYGGEIQIWQKRVGKKFHRFSAEHNF